MDKDNLKNQLNLLLNEAEQFTFDVFPKLKIGDIADEFIAEVIPEWYVWVQHIQRVIKLSFKEDSAPFQLVTRSLEDANALEENGPDVFNRVKRNLTKALELAIKVVEDDTYGELIGHTTPTTTFDPERVFIVHGHNHEAKNELELFLKELGLKPIVLQREADEGQTIIEKFERYSKVGYAIILLTPDDVVTSSELSDDSKKNVERRARQNVIFEFGYFVGRLGRNRVCCLYQEGVTLPSNVHGFIYKSFKNQIDEVKYALIKELRAADYQLHI